MANDSATQRVSISSALAVLKNELNEMRNQDVQLMKQLLTISSSIEQLSKRTRSVKKIRISSRGRRPALKNVFQTQELIKIDEDAFVGSSSDSDGDIDENTGKGIFRTNVKLWKYSQNSDSDSD